MQISGALVEAIVSLLRGIGLLQSPEQEVKVRQSLSDLEAAKAQVWVDFVRASSPNPNRVYVWANSIIALVRPTISLLVVLGMLFAPSRFLELIRTFGEAGPAGWIILSPLLWWFVGRDVNKVLAMHYGGLIPVGSGAAFPIDVPPTGPARQRQEGPDRLIEPFDGGSSDPELRERQFDRPGDR